MKMNFIFKIGNMTENQLIIIISSLVFLTIKHQSGLMSFFTFVSFSSVCKMNGQPE